MFTFEKSHKAIDFQIVGQLQLQNEFGQMKVWIKIIIRMNLINHRLYENQQQMDFYYHEGIKYPKYCLEMGEYQLENTKQSLSENQRCLERKNKF